MSAQRSARAPFKVPARGQRAAPLRRWPATQKYIYYINTWNLVVLASGVRLFRPPKINENTTPVEETAIGDVTINETATPVEDRLPG